MQSKHVGQALLLFLSKHPYRPQYVFIHSSYFHLTAQFLDLSFPSNEGCRTPVFRGQNRQAETDTCTEYCTLGMANKSSLESGQFTTMMNHCEALADSLGEKKNSRNTWDRNNLWQFLRIRVTPLRPRAVNPRSTLELERRHCVWSDRIPFCFPKYGVTKS